MNRRVDKALSGGERHRIEPASVLSMKPTLTILNEPAAGIDMRSINHIINVIRMLKENGEAVLLITHQEEVAAIADSASQSCIGQGHHILSRRSVPGLQLELEEPSEAAIGGVGKKELETLMARGLSPEQAVEPIVSGMPR